MIPPRKHCTKCGCWRPACDFGLSRRRGGKVSLTSWCRTCNRLARRKYAPAGFCKRGHQLTKDNVDGDGRCSICRRNRQRGYMRRPVQREYNRIYREAKRRERGIPARGVVKKTPRPTGSSNANGKLDPLQLSAEPFAKWLKKNKPAGTTVADWSASLGLDDSHAGKIINGEQQSVHIDKVDQALIQHGETFLWELYPDLYDEVSA